MRLVVILLTILMFTGGAVAVSGEAETPSLADQFTGAVSELAGAVEDWRQGLQHDRQQQKQFKRFEEAQRLGCVTPSGTIDEACVEAKIGHAQGASTYDNVVNYTATAWQNGKDFTTETADKIGEKVSTKVSATIDPQVQKIQDLRDQIHTTWLWIKWSILFVLALITLYILEPYISLVNTLLGMVGLAKRRDTTFERLEVRIEELNETVKSLERRLSPDAEYSDRFLSKD